MQLWDSRETFINQAELLAAPVLIWRARKLLYRREVLWFIDNTAAATALIKHTSTARDSRHMAMLVGAVFVSAQVRPWYEYVASAQNPADILSRAGLDAPEVQARIASHLWRELPRPHLDWPILAQPDWAAVWGHFAALGQLC